MRDMRRDQTGGQRAHADLVAAVADRDGAPRPGEEQIVQQRRSRHRHRRRACCARCRPPSGRTVRWPAPHGRPSARHVAITASGDAVQRHHVHRHVVSAGCRQRGPAGRGAGRVGADAARRCRHAEGRAPAARRRPDRRSRPPAASPPGTKNPVMIPTGAAARPARPRPAQTAARRGEHRRDVAPDILLDDRLDPVDQPRGGPCVVGGYSAGESGVPQVGDQHAARRVGDAELRLDRARSPIAA